LRNDDSKLAAAKATLDLPPCGRSRSPKKARRLEAPFAAADAVGASIDLPFDEG